MSDQHNDLHRDTEGQWSNLKEDRSYGHINRNESKNGNDENFLNHQYLLPNQYVHQDLYSSNMLYNNSNDNIVGNSPTSAPSHYTENIFAPQNQNYEVDNVQPNFGCIDWSNGQIMKTKLQYDTRQPQYMVPGNHYDPFKREISLNVPLQQQPHYPMMLNFMTPHHQRPSDISPDVQHTLPNHMLDTRSPILYAEAPPNHPSLGDMETQNVLTAQYLPYEQQPAVPTMKQNPLLDNFLGNWSSNPSGTYTPFGHSFLNVQPTVVLQRDSPNLNVITKPNFTEHAVVFSSDTDKVKFTEPASRKESEGFHFSENTGKKRIIAEVKPMRPSYSAVLSKTPIGQSTSEINKKKSFSNKDTKPLISKLGAPKSDKSRSYIFSDKSSQSEDKNKKSDFGRKTFLQSQLSSGSDSGETNVDFLTKNYKADTKSKVKNDNMNRKWVSLDDLSNDNDPPLEEKPGYTNCDSEFVFLSRPEEKGNKKRNMKKLDINNSKRNEKPDIINSEINTDNTDQSIYNNVFTDSDKLKRKNKDRTSNVTRKIISEKNKRNSQSRQKKSKGSGYMEKLQNYINNWILIIKNVFLWFFHLVVDIFRLSAQLSVDFFSISFKNTCLWAADLWILTKEKATSTEWLCKVGGYIDKKIGHTWLGFWRKLHWMKLNSQSEDEKDSHKKSNSNIPLPGTGDDAMKRLLACKGKDPYSILGVGVQCSDDDIKRYYRRQAFLVHPDKNQQPGAEEAFKILQHAFDLIGEPERREAYDRKLVESAHMEAAWSEVSALLVQLQDKVRHAAATIRCTNCSRRHARALTARPAYAARYCRQCKIHHAAKEGDIWAESTFWGLVWMYYACMDGAVYQITQWASCQKKNLKHLVANSHHVQYRIVLGSKSQPSNGPSGKQNFNSSTQDANLEDFLNNLYTKAGQSTPGTGRNMANTSQDASKQKKKTKKNK